MKYSSNIKLIHFKNEIENIYVILKGPLYTTDVIFSFLKHNGREAFVDKSVLHFSILLARKKNSCTIFSDYINGGLYKLGRPPTRYKIQGGCQPLPTDVATEGLKRGLSPAVDIILTMMIMKHVSCFLIRKLSYFFTIHAAVCLRAEYVKHPIKVINFK